MQELYSFVVYAKSYVHGANPTDVGPLEVVQVVHEQARGADEDQRQEAVAPRVRPLHGVCVGVVCAAQ
jgi:hypothetical protein